MADTIEQRGGGGGEGRQSDKTSFFFFFLVWCDLKRSLRLKTQCWSMAPATVVCHPVVFCHVCFGLILLALSLLIL